MFIINPNPIHINQKQQGIGFGQWIKTQLAYWFIGNNLHLHDKTHPDRSLSPNPNPGNNIGLFKQALLMTFPCDGYDISNHNITDFNGKVKPYNGTESFAALILTTFFGLPNRPLYDAGKFQFPWQIIAFNFFGGIDFSEDISTEKKVWQGISFIFKILIIFPLKVIAILPKIALNILKIFTELLPTLSAFLCAHAYRELFKEREQNEPHKNQNYALIAFPTFLMVIVSFLHFLSKTISLIGRMITSPEKNARLAVAFAHEIKGRVLGLNAGTVVGFIVGTVSVAFTATLWATILPLTIGFGIKFFPTAMNNLYQALLWCSNLPIVAQTLSLLNSIFVPLITALNSLIAPILLPLANSIGLQIAANLFYIGTAIGLLAFPITFLSRVADKLSNAWVKWHKSGPLTILFDGSSSSSTKSTHRAKSQNGLDAAEKPQTDLPAKKATTPLVGEQPDTTPSAQSNKLVNGSNKNLSTASKAAGYPAPGLTPKHSAVVPASRKSAPVEDEHWATQMFRGSMQGMPDQRKYETWYLAALMPVLMNAEFKHDQKSPILYFAPNQNHKNATIPYSQHLKCLATFAGEQKKFAIMISTEPGAGENHFVITLITPSQELFFINLTTSKHKDPMRIFRELQRDKTITEFSIYNSKTPLQHDEGPIVSCGPLCIEVARFIARSVGEIIAQIKAKRIQIDDHFEFDLLETINDRYLELLATIPDQANYQKKLVEIRQSHDLLLASLTAEAVDYYATQQPVSQILRTVVGEKEELTADDFDQYVDDDNVGNPDFDGEDDDSGTELTTTGNKKR